MEIFDPNTYTIYQTCYPDLIATMSLSKLKKIEFKVLSVIADYQMREEKAHTLCMTDPATYLYYYQRFLRDYYQAMNDIKIVQSEIARRRSE